MRRRYPQVTVADLYDHPRLGSLAGYLDELDPPPSVQTRVVEPTPRLTQAAQLVLSLPLAIVGEGWSFTGPKGQQTIRPSDHAMLQPMFQVQLKQTNGRWGPVLLKALRARYTAPPAKPIAN